MCVSVRTCVCVRARAFGVHVCAFCTCSCVCVYVHVGVRLCAMPGKRCCHVCVQVHQDCGDMSIATYEIIEVQVEEGTGEALINLPPDVKVSDVQMVSSVPDLHFEDGPKPLDFQLQVKQADLL